MKPDGFLPEQSQQAAARKFAQERDQRVAESLRSQGAGAFEPAIEMGRKQVEEEQAAAAAMALPPQYSQFSAGAASPQMGQATPFSDDATEYMNEAQRLRALADQRIVTSRANKAYAPTMQLSEEQRAVMQSEAETLDAREDIEGRRRIAQAGASQDRLGVMNAAEARAQELHARRAQHAADVQTTMDGYLNKLDQATQSFREEAQFDPSEAYASKPAGQKLRMFIAAFGRGLAGRDPQDIFRDFVRMETEAHRGRLSQAQQNVQNAQQNARDAVNTVRTNFLTMAQDEREADKMLELASLNKIEATIDRIEKDYAVRNTSVDFSELRNQLDKERSQKTYELNMLVASTPRRIYSSSYALPRERRRGLLRQAEMLDKSAGEALKQRSGSQRDAAKGLAEVSGSAKAAGLSPSAYKEVREYSKDRNNQMRDGAIRSLLDLKEKYIANPENLPGLFGRATGLTPAGHNYNEDLNDSVDEAIRYYSGANAPDPEIMRTLKALKGNINSPFTDAHEQLEINLDRGLKRLQNTRLTAVKGMSAEALQYLGIADLGGGTGGAETLQGGEAPSSLVFDE
jgi:hypothetical protein